MKVSVVPVAVDENGKQSDDYDLLFLGADGGSSTLAGHAIYCNRKQLKALAKSVPAAINKFLAKSASKKEKK